MDKKIKTGNLETNQPTLLLRLQKFHSFCLMITQRKFHFRIISIEPVIFQLDCPNLLEYVIMLLLQSVRMYYYVIVRRYKYSSS